MQNSGNERCVICCGDISGIGPFPEGTACRVMELPGLFACVRGNHEDYLIPGSPFDEMDEAEQISHEWERTALSEKVRSFLTGLPFEQEFEAGGVRWDPPSAR